MIFFFACKDEAGRQLKIVIAAMNKVPFITYCILEFLAKIWCFITNFLKIRYANSTQLHIAYYALYSTQSLVGTLN